MRMEHSQNLYGLFVVYRYVCVDDIIINFTIVVSIQTCLRFYLVLHRFSYMFIDHFVLLKSLSIQHNFLLLLLHVFFLSSNKANLISPSVIQQNLHRQTSPNYSMSRMLKLLSLNVRGLRNGNKRRAIFSYLKKSKSYNLLFARNLLITRR